MKTKIFNVCLGHKEFPNLFSYYYDLMISPVYLHIPTRLAIVPDSNYGSCGSALSEYAQLIWLYLNLTRVLDGHTHIRVFHYRRFVSGVDMKVGRISSNQPWSTVIENDDLRVFEKEFSRVSETPEILNTRVSFSRGALGQYAQNHNLEDILDFCKFLSSERIISETSVVDMLRTSTLVPACNISVLTIENFKIIYKLILSASSFLNSRFYTPRIGYQRRNVGFLLERFQSYLIQTLYTEGRINGIFGWNYILSDSEQVSATL